MKARIVRWNVERGFGFAHTERGQNIFVHVSAVKPIPPGGVDLNGRDLDEIVVAEGSKGLKLESGSLTPLSMKWAFYYNVVKVEQIYFSKVSEPIRLEFSAFETGLGAKPTLHKKSLREAISLGCPAEVVEKALTRYTSLRRAWNAKHQKEVALEDAVQKAISFLKALEKIDRRERKVIIFERTQPQVEYQATAEEFGQKWQQLAELAVVGKNAHFIWAIVPRNCDCDIRVQAGKATARYEFAQVKATVLSDNFRVEKGYLTNGMSGKSSGGIFGMVGQNPNDSEYRNRD